MLVGLAQSIPTAACFLLIGLLETPRDLIVTTVLPPKAHDNINVAVGNDSSPSLNSLTIRTRSALRAQQDTLEKGSNAIFSSHSTKTTPTYHCNSPITTWEVAEFGDVSSRTGVSNKDATKMMCISHSETPSVLECSTLNHLHFIQSPSLAACDWWALYSEYCSMPCEGNYRTLPRHELEIILRSYARKVHSYEDHLRHSDILETFGPCDASCCKNIVKLQPLTSSACTLHRVRNKLQKDWRDGKLSLEAYHNLQAHTFFRILPLLEVSHHGLVKYAMTALASTGDFQAYTALSDFLQKFISPSSLTYRCALLDIASHLQKAGRDAHAIHCLRNALNYAYETILSTCERSYSNCTSLAQATAALTDGRVELSYDHVGMLWYFPVGQYAYREIRAWYILEDGRLDSGELWIHGCALQIMCNMRRMSDGNDCNPKTRCPVRVATCSTLVG